MAVGLMVSFSTKITFPEGHFRADHINLFSVPLRMEKEEGVYNQQILHI